jgi:hypothetical protein
MRKQSYVDGVWNAVCFLFEQFDKELVMRVRVVAVSLALMAAACTGFRHGSTAIDTNQPTVVQVDNQGFLDMAVYVLRSSERLRLGTATGNSKTNFRVPTGIVSGLTPLRFIADPIGGRRASVSEEITVAPGDTVGLTIPPI